MTKGGGGPRRHAGVAVEDGRQLHQALRCGWRCRGASKPVLDCGRWRWEVARRGTELWEVKVGRDKKGTRVLQAKLAGSFTRHSDAAGSGGRQLEEASDCR